MIRLKSLPENAMVYDVFQSRPETFDPFTQACEQPTDYAAEIGAGWIRLRDGIRDERLTPAVDDFAAIAVTIASR